MDTTPLTDRLAETARRHVQADRRLHEAGDAHRIIRRSLKRETRFWSIESQRLISQLTGAGVPAAELRRVVTAATSEADL